MLPDVLLKCTALSINKLSRTLMVNLLGSGFQKFGKFLTWFCWCVLSPPTEEKQSFTYLFIIQCTQTQKLTLDDCWKCAPFTDCSHIYPLPLPLENELHCVNNHPVDWKTTELCSCLSHFASCFLFHVTTNHSSEDDRSGKNGENLF